VFFDGVPGRFRFAVYRVLEPCVAPESFMRFDSPHNIRLSGNASSQNARRIRKYFSYMDRSSARWVLARQSSSVRTYAAMARLSGILATYYRRSPIGEGEKCHSLG